MIDLLEIQKLATLIEEHTAYCQEQYQPGGSLKHLTTEKALSFQNDMIQSLSHLGMWLRTVKSLELKKGSYDPQTPS